MSLKEAGVLLLVLAAIFVFGNQEWRFSKNNQTKNS
jgi:hypothetical protein